MPNGEVNREYGDKQQGTSGEPVENVGMICDSILKSVVGLTEKLSDVLKPDSDIVSDEINNNSHSGLRNQLLTIKYKLSGLARRIDL